MNRATPTALPPVIVLAAGDSSRFWPLSTHHHKAMVRLLGRPLIEYTLRSLKDAGAGEVVIVQSPKPRLGDFEYATVEDYFGSGKELGLKIRYVSQAEPNGQGEAILLASEGIRGDFLVVQPENINAGEIVGELMRARKNGDTGVLAAHEKEETWLFGVFALKGELMQGIVEKPPPGAAPSNLCNMWVAWLGQEYLKLLTEEPDHPYASVRALEKLADASSVRVRKTSHDYFPLKYPWNLFAMRDFLFTGQTKEITIEKGAAVAPTAVVQGPAYIGKGAVVDEFTMLRPGCVIEAGAVVRPYSDLFNCLIGERTNIRRSYLNNSILGADIQVDANLTATNQRLDHGEITVDVKGHTISTSLTKLGTIIGQGTRVGVNVNLLPGVMVGANCHIGPNTVVSANVKDHSHLETVPLEATTRKRVVEAVEKSSTKRPKRPRID